MATGKMTRWLPSGFCILDLVVMRFFNLFHFVSDASSHVNLRCGGVATMDDVKYNHCGMSITRNSPAFDWDAYSCESITKVAEPAIPATMQP